MTKALDSFEERHLLMHSLSEFLGEEGRPWEDLDRLVGMLPLTDWCDKCAESETFMGDPSRWPLKVDEGGEAFYTCHICLRAWYCWWNPSLINRRPT